MPFSLRHATAADVAASAALIVAAFASQPVVLDPPASALGVTADSVAADFAAGGGIVAETGSALVGVVLWRIEAASLHIARLSVAPDWRRRGVARALLAAIETLARARGVHHLWLGTRLALTGNLALFAAAGFREIAQRSHPGYTAPTWVEMARDLHP